MPIVEKHPHIDPTVKYVRLSKLRELSAQVLRETSYTFVIQERERPLAVLVPFAKFLSMQAQLMAATRAVDMLSDHAQLEALKAAESRQNDSPLLGLPRLTRSRRVAR
jgi:hypothetical protein